MAFLDLRGFTFDFVRCCGGLFTTTAIARSKRCQPSWCSSMSEDLGDFAMQPLSRVVSSADMTWGAEDAISSRPKVAVKIAECIAEWSNIETFLGVLLASLLGTEAKTAISIFGAVENRSAQRRIVMAAGQAKLSPDDYDLLEVIMRVAVAPVMRQRDKLAHWSWGTCAELPDDLILQAPIHKTALHFTVWVDRQDHIANVDHVFVITEKYLGELVRDLRAAKHHISNFGATIWPTSSQSTRDQYRDKLLSEPRLRQAWERQKASRQKAPEAPE